MPIFFFNKEMPSVGLVIIESGGRVTRRQTKSTFLCRIKTRTGDLVAMSWIIGLLVKNVRHYFGIKYKPPVADFSSSFIFIGSFPSSDRLCFVATGDRQMILRDAQGRKYAL
ncbi:hypothetical protein NPIL_201471 [Nephila pilipes]|uniref:Uncharacterized protein n=1 Tax=Nephila pilipes TaxID=299642 RepID=A0A8X6NAD8_NEPPI|nr:hypothetical protein NPIL_201471 [Nephila pilipes]